MKRLLSLVLIIAGCTGLAGCDEQDDTQTRDQTETIQTPPMTALMMLAKQRQARLSSEAQVVSAE